MASASPDREDCNSSAMELISGMNRRLPVTLVGGFLGAGKTSLLHHRISEHQGGHLAVLVENPGVLNLDAKALSGLCGAMRRSSDIVLEIPAGGEAAQVEWIAARLREFSLAGRFEQVLIEVAGTAEVAWLARHFGLLPGQPETFSPWAELHQSVCVVDALDCRRAARTSPPDALWDFQSAQITGASLLVLNKCDLVSDAERSICTRLLRSINPEAKIVETAYGEVPPDIWSRPAPPQELSLALERKAQPSSRDGQTPPDLASALYRAYRPFHPERFWRWFNAEHEGLLRVKGIVWLATRSLLVGGVSRTRWQNGCGPAGIWWAALPREEWPAEPGALARMQETWREPYGDRRQELVLIGGAPLLAGLNRGLNACLLTDEEYGRPVPEWGALPDPFPEWDLGED